MRLRQETVGELSIFLSCVFFTGASLAVKYAAAFCSGNLISFFRFLLGGAAAYIIVRSTEKPFRVYDRSAWLLRGLIGGLCMSAGYIAIQMTSSGRATLLSNTYPIFSAVFGFVFFKEKVTWNNWLGLLLCFGGIILVFQDNSRYPMAGNLVALFSGVLGGLAVQYLKKARTRNSPASVYFAVCLFGLVFNSWALKELPHLPRAAWPYLGLAAGFALAGQLLIGYGYRYVTATQGSIIGFFETLLTLVFSFYLVGEEMRPRFYWGAGVVVLGLMLNQSLLVLQWEKTHWAKWTARINSRFEEGEGR